ncbi:hypothetical protein IC607_02925 [Cellulomonas sp. JH27-2]|uniref:hypothetical protein n=1 Tax=Cellulomonas sp. JH27-2 TaxID=2774139 RepID=UPI00177FC2A0|nr:hypothetical protein [Cellulomonas sp. JH27-2]MBD8057916.1 hypothetical protein [Cellulomonas sp. JH27-2]
MQVTSRQVAQRIAELVGVPPRATTVLEAEADPVYTAKSAFIAEHGLVVLHLHDAWHDRRPDGIRTGTARALRYVGEPGSPVSAVALQPGFQGFALNRRALARPDVDVIVIGEGHEWETSGRRASTRPTRSPRGGAPGSSSSGTCRPSRIPVELVATADPFRTVVR